MRFITKYIERIKKNRDITKLVRNVFISFVGEGGAAVVTLLTTVLLILTIGNNDFGVLTIAYSYITIVDSIVNFQSWNAVVKFGSEDIENNDITSLEGLIKVCSIVDLVTALLGFIASFLLIGIVSSFLNWEDNIQQLVFILSFQIIFNFTGTSIGVIRLLDKFKYFSIYRICAEVLRFIFVFVFCTIFKQGIVGASYAYTISYILGYMLLFAFFIKSIREDKRLSLKRIIKCKTQSTWKRVLSFTIWTNLSSSADIPVQQFDIIFLSLLSNEVVAVFKVYKQIGAILNKLTTPLKQAVMPLYSEYIAKKQYEKCYNYLIKIRNKSATILFPVIAIVICAGLPLMNMILGNAYVKYWPILVSYMMLRAFALCYTTIHALFISMGEVKRDFFYTISANIAYIIITWLLISKIGIWAIIVGMAVQYFSLIYLKKWKISCIIKKSSL